METERVIWDYLLGQINNPVGVAALMGNLRAESALRPENVQNSYEKKLGDDKTYTERVDKGIYTREQFSHDSAGYGLAQWTYWSRKAGLWDYQKTRGNSIADLEGQLGYLCQELQTSYKSVWQALVSASSIYDATAIVLRQYERPANQTDANVRARAVYSQRYYDSYAGQAPATPAEDPKKILAEIKEKITILEGLL